LRKASPSCFDPREEAIVDFRKLEVWHVAHQLTLDVYRACTAVSARDRFELAGQMRRAAVSIESNIAEGNGRRGDREFARYLRIALGSAHELETQVLIAKDLEIFDSASADALVSAVARVRRMLYGLIRRLTANTR
jgi:four helix bundle protein